jgi:serine/threonine protein kinase
VGRLYGRLSGNVDAVLTERRQLGLVRDICLGMSFLHAHSVAHRDLKSANVLFNKRLQAPSRH